MRKTHATLLLVLFVLGLAAVSSAQQTPAKPAPAPKPAGKEVIGTVESFTPGDAAKGVKAQIVVVDKAGAKVTCLVKATTPVRDAAGKPLTLDKIVKGAEVRVRYTTNPQGVNEALFIKFIK